MMSVEILEGDCLDVMAAMAKDSIDCIITDPPYFKVKGDSWDRQWDKPAGFLAWLDRVLEQFYRILKPNGSLYLFASPRMAARVEVLVGERFNVLNSIRWVKDAGWARKQCKEEMRAFWPASETIIFAEHAGADNIAKGEAGYAARCDQLRGFVFEPIYRYIADQFEVSKLTRREVDDYFRTANVSQYWLQCRGFIIPTAEKWQGLQSLRPGHFCREYEDLRREYEDLRREYEDLRRPFSVTSDVPYTDVWTFPTVHSYKGKHPCEKPLAMIRHMVKASTRPGATILDPFAGSGTTGVAAIHEGRNAILIEKEPSYVPIIRKRIAEANGEFPLFQAGTQAPFDDATQEMIDSPLVD